MKRQTIHLLWLFSGIIVLVGISIALDVGDDSECAQGESILTTSGAWACVDLNSTILSVVDSQDNVMTIHIDHSMKAITIWNISESNDPVYNFTVIGGKDVFPIGGYIQ